MSNGFKKGVSLLVTAGLLASLAATAFAGTATAAYNPLVGPTVAVTVPGDAAYTPLPDAVLTMNGTDDISVAYPAQAGDNLRIHVANGFELDPTVGILVTVVQGSGGLMLSADPTNPTVGPGALSTTVFPVTTSGASYFDVPIWQSSGNCSATNCTLTFHGGAVRQRQGAAASGMVVDINHNSVDPGNAVALPFTLWTLTGTSGVETGGVICTPSPILPALNGAILPAVGRYTTCTATGTGVDWAGNSAPATAFNPATVTWDAGVGPGTLSQLVGGTANIMQYWGPTAGTYTVTATDNGISASGTFVIGHDVLALQSIDISPYSGTLTVGQTQQFVATCHWADAFGNTFDVSTGLDGTRPPYVSPDNPGCFGTWSDSPLMGAGEINFTGLLFAKYVGVVDYVAYTVGNISGKSGPWSMVTGQQGGGVIGNAVPSTPFSQASPIIRAGGYGDTTAAYTYTEPVYLPPTALNPYPSGAALFPATGFTWTIDISDAQGNRRVHFDTSTAPTLSMPDSLNTYSTSCVNSGGGATFLNDYTLRIKVCSSNTSQIESVSISGLKVKADADAALGAIRTRYVLDTSQFTFGGNGSGVTAYGFIANADALPGSNLFLLQQWDQVLNPTAPAPGPTFKVTAGDVGNLNFTDTAFYNTAPSSPNPPNAGVPNPIATNCISAGSCPSTESVAVTSVLDLGAATPATGGGEIFAVTTALRASKHNKGTLVWQSSTTGTSCLGSLPNPAGVHTYGVCALPSIGTVVDSLKLTHVTQTQPQRGLPNNLPFGTVGLEERTTGAEGNGSSAGLLAAGTVITISLDPTQGVVFSQPPTAMVTWTKAAALGILCGFQAIQAAATAPYSCSGLLTRGALVVPYQWAITTAVFAPTDADHGNFFINDVPATFENTPAVAPTPAPIACLGGGNCYAATVSPSTNYDHSSGVPVGQDSYGPGTITDSNGGSRTPGAGILGTGELPLTLYNPAANVSTCPASSVNGQVLAGTCYYADLSPDRLSATFRVRTPDVGPVVSKLYIDGFIDVSASATAGGSVVMTVATSAGAAAAGKVGASASSIPVIPGSVTVGYLNNVIDATAQAIPSIIIGANDQATGTVVIREAASAAWLDASAGHNLLRICYVYNNLMYPNAELFTRAPWAVVTSGDLKLRANSDPTLPAGAAAPGTGVRGYLGAGGTGCAQWIVSNYSGTGATIEIRGSASDGTMLPAGPNNGPHVNVPASMVPGPALIDLWGMPADQYLNPVGYSGTEFQVVQNAVRVYGANVTVAAVSQPEIRRGLLNQPAGDVTITETAVYQLGQPYLGSTGQAIWFQIVRNNTNDTTPPVYFNTDRVTPVVSSNGSDSGLIAQFGAWFNNTTFSVNVVQRAFVPVTGSWVPGKITVSGLQYSATNAALLGPVQLQVCSSGGMTPTPLYTSQSQAYLQSPPCPTYSPYYKWSAENPANFNQTVSNAKVVEDSSILGAIAPGVAGPGTNKWTFNTVIVKKGTYITLRLQAVKGAVVGDPIEIWGRAGKTGTWKKLTTRLVGANGYIFYFKKVSGYTEFQAYFPGSNTAAASYAVPRYYRATVSK